MVISTSYILLRGVRFHAFIGVGEQERCVGNDYILDLRIGYSLANAMESDDVMDTLNYAEVYDLIKECYATSDEVVRSCSRLHCR